MDSTYITKYASPIKENVLRDVNSSADSAVHALYNLSLLADVAAQCDYIRRETGSSTTHSIKRNTTSTENIEAADSTVHPIYNLSFLADVASQCDYITTEIRSSTTHSIKRNTTSTENVQAADSAVHPIYNLSFLADIASQCDNITTEIRSSTTHSIKRNTASTENVQAADSAVHPLYNLNLLAHVASQCDYIRTETGSSTTHSIKRNTTSTENVKVEATGPGQSGTIPISYVCGEFIKLYPLNLPENDERQIKVTDLAAQMKVRVLRVYDIVNVAESMNMATKVREDLYTWTGNTKLKNTLRQLKSYAEEIGLTEYVRNEQFNRTLYGIRQNGRLPLAKSSMFPQIKYLGCNEEDTGILCQRFVMIFLVSLENGVIDYELAKQIIYGEDDISKRLGARRLYVIANILVSFGIIKRVSWRKAIFQYTGPPLNNLEDSSVKSSKPEDLRKNPSPDKTDHSHFRNLKTPTETLPVVVDPVPKKRSITHFFTKSSLLTKGTMLRVVGSNNLPEPLLDGVVYNAIKVGNSIQLVRKDNS